MAAASQTLAALVRGFSGFKVIEKNLLAKKFFKSIIYSKESIELNLFLPPPAKSLTLIEAKMFKYKASNGVKENHFLSGGGEI